MLRVEADADGPAVRPYLFQGLSRSGRPSPLNFLKNPHESVDDPIEGPVGEKHRDLRSSRRLPQPCFELNQQIRVSLRCESPSIFRNQISNYGFGVKPLFGP